MTKYPDKIKLVEVGPRDGLQNEAGSVSLQDKVSLVDLLSQAGFNHIEAGSFVSAKKIPQMSNSLDVFKQIDRQTGTIYSALVPNERGMLSALEAQVDEIAIFTASSETFAQKNINCSVKESLERFKPVLASAHQNKLSVRAYISCVIACPYEGKTNPDSVRVLAETLLDMGCYEVSLGDTIGVATPSDVFSLLDKLLKSLPSKSLAVHFHDTYGQALANILTALEMGITVIDSSIAGLGGCPYAKGSTGNVASEDVIYMLNGMNIETNINLDKAIRAGNYICEALNIKTRSKVASAQ